MLTGSSQTRLACMFAWKESMGASSEHHIIRGVWQKIHKADPFPPNKYNPECPGLVCIFPMSILYYIDILYYNVVYYILLCIVLYCVRLYYIISYHIILLYYVIILYYTVLYHIVLYYIILYCIKYDIYYIVYDIWCMIYDNTDINIYIYIHTIWYNMI